ncbi:MAG: hypothetical protein C4321_08710, partial [Chloroflexota bacterium]
MEQAMDSAASRAERPNAGWKLALPGYRFTFPRDHGSHPDYATEWWYYTGHLRARNRSFGFELTLFRIGLEREAPRNPSRWAFREVFLGHFALTDENGRAFYFWERAARPALGMAGADVGRLNVWIRDWRVRMEGDTHVLHAAGDAASGVEEDAAPSHSPPPSLSLELRPAKPLVIHGENGVSQKAVGLGRASHYYSFTRLVGAGEIILAGERSPVNASVWMDH